jgi:hypothetical protein
MDRRTIWRQCVRACTNIPWNLGDDGMTEYNWRLNRPPKSKPQKESVAESNISEEVKKFFRIYFPTHETVAKSKGGIGVSSTYFVKGLPYVFILGRL